jgi:hypothetical protein
LQNPINTSESVPPSRTSKLIPSFRLIAESMPMPFLEPVVAELGRAAGDAGGPLLVGGIATAACPVIAVIALGGVAAAVAALTLDRRRPARHDTGAAGS